MNKYIFCEHIVSLQKAHILNNPKPLPRADSLLAGAPGVLSSPFMHGLATPLTAPYAGGVAGALPGLGGFALGQAAPGLRGLTNPGLALATVLLVSNLNEEVSAVHGRCKKSL